HFLERRGVAGGRLACIPNAARVAELRTGYCRRRGTSRSLASARDSRRTDRRDRHIHRHPVAVAAGALARPFRSVAEECADHRRCAGVGSDRERSMSDAYFLLKVVHILSATVLFGTGLGTAVHFWLAHRSGNAAAIAVVARNVVLADFALTAPSGVVQPTTGIALAHLSGWPLLSLWLLATYALYALAFACWAPVVVLQMRARDLAAAAVRCEQSLP